MPETWFKVTGPNGESISGGHHNWSLPVDGKPGEWAPDVRNPVACARGYHLTIEPVVWFKDASCKVWVAEGEGASSVLHGDKQAFERARLVRRATVAELAALRIVSEGYHEFSGDLPVIAYGSASVTASGSARVTASGSASVTASGSASVSAYGSASVSAYGSASVTAKGSDVVVQPRNIYAPSKGLIKLSENACRIDQRNERVRCFRAKVTA